MVQTDVHRPLVLPRQVRREKGKTRTSLADIGQPSCVLVAGSGRKLFFSCSGYGTGRSRNNRGSNGNYWSVTFNSARNARNLNFNPSGVNPQNNNNRYNGLAVRPVQHTPLTILFLTR